MSFSTMISKSSAFLPVTGYSMLIHLIVQFMKSSLLSVRLGIRNDFKLSIGG